MTNIIIPITQEAMLDFVFVACQLPSSKVFVGICKDIFEKNKPKKMKNVEWVVF